MKLKIVAKRWFVPMAVLGIVALSAGAAWLTGSQVGQLKTRASVVSLVKSCPGAKLNDMECQKQYYRDKHRDSGVQAAFADMRREYAANGSVKANCHQLTHVIGRGAAAKYGDVAKAYEDGNEFCWSGYYHGVMEQLLLKYKDGDVVSHLNDICDGVSKGSQRYSFKHYNCAHGLGHGIMLIQGDELFDSLATCDGLTDDWERRSCYGGVYMENIMADINPDHSTKYIRADDPLYPCTAVAARYADECYLMQTSQSLRVLGGDFGKVFALCAGIPEVNQPSCFQSLGRDASGNSNSNVTTTHDTCMLAPTTAAREGCVIGAVKDFISYHHSDTQATELCGSFPADLATLCNSTKEEYYRTF